MKVKIKYYLLFIILTTLVSCQSPKNKVKVKTFKENGVWVYEITVNDKIFIHQDCVPTLEGNKPFANKKEAELVGNLIKQKILNKETPAVNTGELRQLGIKGTS
ncbi:DUF4907 domain-containing protein [Saccharicrinis fermentans]|nr:DUF4907 domain-containing protein [Saccharicrinis fermentans]